MNDEVVKICINCGPRTKEQVRFRKTRKEIICKACDSLRQKERRSADPVKAKAHGDKYRYVSRPEDTTEMRCSKCETIKPINLFNKHMIKIRYPYCISCRREATNRHHSSEENKERHKKWYAEQYEPTARDLYYMRKYGITLHEYQKMSILQNDLCKICLQPDKTILREDGAVHLVVDHCHDSGKIRGLLCRSCNLGLGFFADSPSVLEKAIAYLKMHGKT